MTIKVEIPPSCRECNLGWQENMQYWCCSVMEDRRVHVNIAYFYRPSWCPLDDEDDKEGSE